MARPQRTTPWLRKRDGIYYAFWYDLDKQRTRRLSLRTGHDHEAENRFAEFLINGRELRHARVGGLTVIQALDDYCEEHPVVATKRRDISVRHLKAFFGARLVETIDIPLSREYAKARREGLIGGGRYQKNRVGKDSTIARELTVLSAAANHAHRWKRIQTKPSIEKPHVTRAGEDDEAPYYTHDELARIMAAAEAIGGELEWFTKLLYRSGARRASIENLTREQVQWPAKRILLQKPGKRSTNKRQPIIPILKDMEAPLRALCDSSTRSRLFDRQEFYWPYREMLESLGLADRAHPHCMRHTRATHLLQAGKSIYDVARLLGDTIRTVERVYGHHSAGYLSDALED